MDPLVHEALPNHISRHRIAQLLEIERRVGVHDAQLPRVQFHLQLDLDEIRDHGVGGAGQDGLVDGVVILDEDDGGGFEVRAIIGLVGAARVDGDLDAGLVQRREAGVLCCVCASDAGRLADALDGGREEDGFGACKGDADAAHGNVEFTCRQVLGDVGPDGGHEFGRLRQPQGVGERLRGVDVGPDVGGVDGGGIGQGGAVGDEVGEGLVVTRRADGEVAAGEDGVEQRGDVGVGEGQRRVLVVRLLMPVTRLAGHRIDVGGGAANHGKGEPNLHHGANSNETQTIELLKLFFSSCLELKSQGLWNCKRPNRWRRQVISTRVARLLLPVLLAWPVSRVHESWRFDANYLGGTATLGLWDKISWEFSGHFADESFRSGRRGVDFALSVLYNRDGGFSDSHFRPMPPAANSPASI